jgi:NAD-dependent DNA ligase
MVALPDYRTDTALYFSKSNGYRRPRRRNCSFTFNNGLVHNYSDLYELTVEQILPLREWLKISRNLVKGVADSKKIPFERVLYALGIRFRRNSSQKN